MRVKQSRAAFCLLAVATLEMAESGVTKLDSSVSFGVRTVELPSSTNETSFFVWQAPVPSRRDVLAEITI